MNNLEFAERFVSSPIFKMARKMYLEGWKIKKLANGKTTLIKSKKRNNKELINIPIGNTKVLTAKGLSHVIEFMPVIRDSILNYERQKYKK